MSTIVEAIREILVPSSRAQAYDLVSIDAWWIGDGDLMDREWRRGHLENDEL